MNNNINNNRNQYGVKNSSDTYLKGGKWLQWTDNTGNTLEDAKKRMVEEEKKYPTYNFMIKKIYDKIPFYRIYYNEK